MTQLVAMNSLTYREQLRLLEIAADADDRAVRELARDVLAQYRQPPIRIDSILNEQNARPESCEHGNPKGACTVCHMREQAQKGV